MLWLWGPQSPRLPSVWSTPLATGYFLYCFISLLEVGAKLNGNLHFKIHHSLVEWFYQLPFIENICTAFTRWLMSANFANPSMLMERILRPSSRAQGHFLKDGHFPIGGVFDKWSKNKQHIIHQNEFFYTCFVCQNSLFFAISPSLHAYIFTLILHFPNKIMVFTLW